MALTYEVIATYSYGGATEQVGIETERKAVILANRYLNQEIDSDINAVWIYSVDAATGERRRVRQANVVMSDDGFGRQRI